jgi:ATP-dependent DNA helicase DinG
VIPSLTPSDLGFLPKFQSWRPGQTLAINRGLTSLKRFIAHSMPVGEGKSGYYIAHALLAAKRACILTSSKALQTQLQDDFSCVGLVDMRGRNNYPCSHPDCHTGTCEEGQYYKCDSCPYEDARNEAMSASLVVTNYSYFMLSSLYGRGLGEFDMLILDEAHSSDEEVCSAASIDVTFAEANKIGQRLPHEDSGMDKWWEWAESAGKICKDRLDELKQDVDLEKRERGKVHPATARDLKFWTRAGEKCVSILSSKIKDGEEKPMWIVTRNRDGYHLEPVWAYQYSEKLLFRGIKKVILVSATMVPKTMALLGVPKEDCDYYEYPSSFPPKSSPVYLFGSARIDHKTDPAQLAVWMSRIDNVIRRRLDRKGIIHCVSYDRGKYIVENSEFAPFMIFPDSGKDTQRCVDDFKASEPPSFLISPAISTGLDFPFSQCELNIIAKVPFLDTRDKIIAARQHEDKDYSAYVTAQTIVQAHGRSMRAADDRSETFLLDAHFNWFFYRNRHLFPSWFHRLVTVPRGMPEPPAPLNKLAVIPLPQPAPMPNVIPFPKSKTS